MFLTFHMPSLLSSIVSLLETLRDFLVTKTQTLILFLFITWSKWLPELLFKSAKQFECSSYLQCWEQTTEFLVVFPVAFSTEGTRCNLIPFSLFQILWQPKITHFFVSLHSVFHIHWIVSFMSWTALDPDPFHRSGTTMGWFLKCPFFSQLGKLNEN